MDPRALPVPDEWVTALDSWCDMLRAGGASPQTIATRVDHGRRVARAMGGSPSEVTATRLTSWAGGQSWARDASPATTQRYVRPPDDAMRAAMLAAA